MVEIFIAIAGAIILIPILLFLPSVFPKTVTFLHIFLAAVYFLVGLFLNHYFHWLGAASSIVLLAVFTSYLFSRRAERLNGRMAEEEH
ncbi:hypothetical protein [Salipaludibacillus aurantiacus]|uniref:Uncharacterized protein n=1 Tax=Salipaludibacillus aurantiacus TaxID=1601833 RepID=A0A1H9T4X0_9BACI|nr:hypothetical protein [Salipaludibacillus aurantiacus]SER92272.1 hypothetical protein SAMN05518684_105125 [Salipaludibacillus aurantiacus]